MSASRLTSPLAPDLGPRFVLTRRLGGGGFGEVYEALDRERGMVVALKILRRVEPAALYKFKHEFRSLVDISHPNLLTLYELFSHGARWFFTMERVHGLDALAYVQGDDHDRAGQASPSSLGSSGPGADALAALAPTRAVSAAELPLHLCAHADDQTAPGAPAAVRRFTDYIDEERLRRVLQQLAYGLCFLHDAGKLHRDIKPSNMLVTPEGRLVLLDFGLVREVEGSLSGDGIVGTPGYMSPEQAALLPLGPPGDWYSAGVFLYEAICGRLPFEGAFLKVLARKQTEDPPRVDRLCEGAPGDLVDLCHDLLRRDPAERPTGRQVLQRLGRRGAQPAPVEGRAEVQSFSSGRVPALLLGRAEVLHALSRALNESASGEAVAALLHGGAGMGKSTLLRSFCDHAGVTALVGRCYPQESVPYKAMDGVIDALSRTLRRLPLPEAQSLLPKDVLELARLFPVLSQVEAVRTAPRPQREIADQREVRRRAFAALRELLGRLADREPLILAIDDLQWGDVDSGVLLADLMRPPDAPALLLLCCYRSEEAETSPCLRALLPALREARVRLREARVEPLAEDDALALAEELLGQHGKADPARAGLAREIAQESRGQPALLMELARFQAGAQRQKSEGRALLEEVVRSRVSALDEPARRLLQAVAVAGQPVERAVLERATAQGAADDCAHALAQLRGAHLVRLRTGEEREEIEPYYNRVSEIVLQGLTPAALREQHLRLAEALLEARIHGRRTAHADDETLASHYQAAGARAEAARHARLAASQAEAALAFDRAARLYEVALEGDGLDTAGRRLLLRQRAEALRNAGRGTEAARAYLLAADAWAGEPQTGQALELRRRAAEQFLHSGRRGEGVEVLSALLREIGLPFPQHGLALLARLLFLRALLLFWGLRFRPRPPGAAAARDLLRIDTCWAAATGLGNVDPLRGAYFSTLHLRLTLQAGEPERVVRALAQQVSFAALSGGEAPGRMERRALERLEALRGHVEAPYARAMIALFLGIADVLHGRWADALEKLEQATDLLRERCAGVAWELGSAQHFALLCLGVMGRWRELCQRLPGILQDARQRGDRYAEATIRARTGHLPALFADDPEEAAAQAREMSAHQEVSAQGGYPMQHYLRLVSQVEIALYQESGVGRGALLAVEGAWPALRRGHLLRAQSIRADALTQWGNALLAAAALDPGGEGGVRERLRLLQKARRLGERLLGEGVPWIAAKARLLLAGAAQAAGRTGEAAALLSAAEEGFARCGMEGQRQVARRRLGQVRGGAEGRALVEEADERLRAQGVKDPARLAAMFAPGVWPG
jgi:serine/threonine protein kinase